MNRMIVLTGEGETELEWDPGDPESTATAHAEFKRLRKEGYEAYTVVATRGRKVERFDKNLGKLIMAPGAAAPKKTTTGRRPSMAMAGGPVAQFFTLSEPRL